MPNQKAKSGQKNISVDPGFAKMFDEWVQRNGYTQSTVFRAAVLAFMAMGHDQRARWFSEAAGVGEAPSEGEAIRGAVRRAVRGSGDESPKSAGGKLGA